jgi:uncharacterized membrane protein YczE
MFAMLRVKTVPTTGWSSPRPLSFLPAPMTLLMLCIGLVLFGLGEALLINAGIGVSPWTVFSQGVANVSGLGIGVSTFFIGVGVLLLWIPLKQTPGLGTLLNIVIISVVLELSLPYLPLVTSLFAGLVQTFIGVLTVGLGSGIYLVANLGAGPRDGVMKGLQRVSNLPIAVVRMGIELTVVGLGWALGGVAGMGTLIFALFIGPAVSIGLYSVAWFSGVASAGEGS